MEDGRWRALGRRGPDQALRRSVLRVRPTARRCDDPPRPPSDGARDPLPATLPPRQCEGLIDSGTIDGGTDGLSVSRRRLGGRPPRAGPEEGTDLPPVRLRAAPSRPAAIPDSRPARGPDAHQTCPPRPYRDDPAVHPPARR